MLQAEPLRTPTINLNMPNSSYVAPEYRAASQTGLERGGLGVRGWSLLILETSSDVEPVRWDIPAGARE